MDRVETLVRDTLQDKAAGAPPADNLLAAVSRRVERRGRMRWQAAAAAAVVAGLAVALSLMAGPHASGPHAPTSGRGTSAPGPAATPTPTTPTGYRRIAYHGITVAVPERLPLLTVPCSLPAEYVLAVDPSVAYSCPAERGGPRRTRFSVELASDPRGSVPHASLARDHAVVDGSPALIGYGRIPDFPGVTGQLVLSSAGVTVTVTAPDRATVRSILTSAHLGADPLGCPSQLTGTTAVRSTTNPAADNLIPGQPTAAVWCVFASPAGGVRWLLASYPVRPAALPGLVRAVDALPLGPPGTDQQAFYERDLLRLDYPGGSSRMLALRVGDPTEYTDGQRTGLDHADVVTDRLRAATR
jgi:hypothetical protein